MICPHVVHLDPYGAENRRVFYCTREAGHDGDHYNEKRPGVSRQEAHQAATDSDTYQEASAMNDSTRTHSLGHQGGVQMSPTGERGVVHLGMVQSTGDAVIYSLTTDQARDLADSIFIGADQIDAAQERDGLIEALHSVTGSEIRTMDDLYQWAVSYGRLPSDVFAEAEKRVEVDR